MSCLRYCKSTIFQANHNIKNSDNSSVNVVCDTAKVRFFKQITTAAGVRTSDCRCLRYCKSTIFQANHNAPRPIICKQLLFAILQKYDFSSKSQRNLGDFFSRAVVCDTAKVRFFKQITTRTMTFLYAFLLFVILQKYDFSSKSQQWGWTTHIPGVVCDTAKVRFFKQITTWHVVDTYWSCLDF